MNELKGKKILFLAPSFFGYEISIKEKLVEMGAKVTFCDDDPSSFISTLIETCKHYGRDGKRLISHFENKVYNRIKGDKYHLILVINGWAITSRLISMIRDELLEEHGKMILYYWDSISVLKDDEKRRQYFDSIYTFDNVDQENNKDSMKLLPLFFCDEYDIPYDENKNKYDLLTVGSYKYNRYFEIKKIQEKNPSIKIMPLLYAKRMVLVHKLLRKKYRDVDVRSFIYKPLSRNEIIDLISESNAVLDIPMKGQNGLTMRTFECLGMRKKIITSNPNVKKYDFYNPDFVYIINTEDFLLPEKAWFEKKIEFNDSVIKKYSISSWLRRLLEL